MTPRRRVSPEWAFRALMGALLAAFLMVAVLSFGLLHAAADAQKAAKRAEANSQRIERTSERLTIAESAFCGRLQRVREATNRVSGIVFVVLTKTTRPALQRLGRLPSFEPATDCQEAVLHPRSYDPGDSIQFEELTPAQVRRILEHKR